MWAESEAVTRDPTGPGKAAVLDAQGTLASFGTSFFSLRNAVSPSTWEVKPFPVPLRTHEAAGFSPVPRHPLS